MNYNKQINVIFGKLLLTIFVTFLAFNTLFAAEGDLDLTFNGNGKVITQIGDATDDSKASVIQPDGKIVVAGWSYCCMHNPSYSNFAVARYNTDGSLDSSFGDYGKVVTGIGRDSWAYAVAIQPDGKIVVAGASNGVNSTSFTLVRYNVNGTIDDSFGEKGIVVTSEILNSEALGVTIQPDEKIVAIGSSNQPFGNTQKMNLAIARYNSDGSLDTSFDNDGIIISQDPVQGNIGYSVAIQSDGKILTYTAFGIYRRDADGSIDSTFGTQGKIDLYDYQQLGNSKSLVIQPDGKFVAAAYTQAYGNSVLRFNYDGTLDLSFNRTGAVSLNGGDGYGASVAIQADMKIVVAQARNGCTSITRLNSGGQIDTTYDGDGMSLNCNYQHNSVRQVSVATQPDLKIVTTIFFEYTQIFRDFAVERHNNDGSYDTEFGSNGQVRTGDLTGNAYMTSMAMQPDGKIVATGGSNFFFQGGVSPFLVARYNSNGTLDNSFGTGGKVSTVVGVPFSSAKAHSVAIQPDGKIVVAGETTFGECSRCFVVIRYNQNGSLDTSFDNDGIVLTQTTSHIGINSVFVQLDGKITAISYRATIRYNADGSLDTSFGNNGILTYQNNMFAKASSLQNDGKIVVGCEVSLNSTTYFVVSRYNSDGSIDAAFGENGQVLVRSEDYSEINTLKIQSDGKIVVLGRLSNRYILIRYNSDGSLDNTFAVNGKLITKTAGSSFEFQQDGKIVFAGNKRGGFLGIRLNTDGSLDNSLTINTETIGKSSFATKILIQPDGKIVVGGTVDDTFGLMRFQGTSIAVNAGISGRITTASGRGIQNVSVQISGENLSEPKFVKTNAFGYYRFQDLQVGQNYVLGVAAKRYSFANSTRVITLNEDLTGEDFVSNDK